MIIEIIVGGIIVLFLIAVGGHTAYKKSFKYKCMVAIPTGKDGNDVIWAEDTFKIKRVGEHDEILLYKHKGKAYAPPYNFWSKWIKGAVPGEDVSAWSHVKGDLRKSLIRGAMFMRVSEDEYKVLQIDTDTQSLHVLDNDSKELYLDSLRKANELTKNKNDTLIKAVVWVASLIIIAALAVTVLLLTQTWAEELAINAIREAASAAGSQQGVGA